MHSMLLGVGHGPQGQVDLRRRLGGLAQLGGQVLGALAGDGEPLLGGEALGLEAHGQVLRTVVHLVGDERLGHLVLDQLGQRRAGGLAQRALGLGLADERAPVADRLPQRVDGVELAVLGRPLVVGVGQHPLADLLDQDLEPELALLVGVGVGGVELEDVAGLGAGELLVDLGGDRAGAHRVAVVVGGQPVLRLAVERAGDVDDDGVLGLRRPVDVGEGGLHLAHAVDLGVDLFLGQLGPGELDPQPAVARHLHDGADLDDGVEGDRPVLLPGGDVDVGRVDGVDVVVGERLGVVLGQRVVQGLLAADLGAEAALEHLAGRLAGPEPGNADLARDLAEREVDRLVELVLVDLDGELDLVSLEGCDGGLHRGVSVTGACLGPDNGRPGTGRGRDLRYARRARPPGSGAAEAHLLWVQEVGGSIPPSPTHILRPRDRPDAPGGRRGLTTGTAASHGLGALPVAAVFLVSIPVAFWSTTAAKCVWILLVPAQLLSGRTLDRRTRATAT